MTHVWLMAMGAPEDGDRRAWLRKVWARRLPSGPWGRFLLWLVSWFQNGTMAPLLTGPSDLASEARELGRLLGPRYVCHPVLTYGHTPPEAAARAVPRRGKVLLLPLAPHALSRAAVEEAAAVLDGHPVAKARDVAQHPEVIEALAETVRSSLVDLGTDQSCGVLFCAQPWTRNEAVLEQATAIARAVARAVPLESHRIEIGLVPPPGVRRVEPSLLDAVQGLDGVDNLLVVPVGTPGPGFQIALDGLAGTFRRILQTEALGVRPTYVRALINIVHATEKEAGWDAS